ncbi:lysine N(6)-hydroxylase/L-ornithine N(5)-oxygenase family protein (plasmid) [Tistrella bauzanensis]|uniref:Lysine N(6)-hydroxylase/L-ornithine N(5)-oxygenase family protein n=2 Tax=Geminicoccaceae TaxID=2066434 RepID=A0ABU9YP29_9PROT
MTIEDGAYDVIGVGFGPSNLALAIALDGMAGTQRAPAPGASAREAPTRGDRRRVHFIEKQPEFRWHSGMLLPDSRMQVSFLKDLITLHDPTSPFTFIAYLHAKGRLVDFINQKSFFPSRIEFNDYLRWAAARFADRCSYGEEVVAVDPVAGAGGRAEPVQALAVRSVDAAGRERLRLTRDLVLAIGGRPRIPEPFRPLAGDGRVFHSSTYLRHLDRLAAAERAGRGAGAGVGAGVGAGQGRVAVIGGGQSAAEIFFDIRDRFPDLRVDLILRGSALKPADDSPFVNEIFNPSFTDVIFRQPDAERQALLQDFRSTNYSVVDLDLIRKIYEALYQQKVSGVERLRVLRGRRITGVAADASGVVLGSRDVLTGDSETTGYQAVILATGYDRDVPGQMVAGLAPHVVSYAPDRWYRAQTAPGFGPRIFLQGSCEDSHGLSDTLLSVVVVRAHEIAAALLDGTLSRVFDSDAHDIVPQAVGAGRRP